MAFHLPERPRRLRQSPVHRALHQETQLRSSDLIYPMFLVEEQNLREPIESLPGQERFSVDRLPEKIEELLELGIGCINLFGSSSSKSPLAEAATDPEGVVPRALRMLKERYPALSLQTDIALDPYTDHGHDGVMINGQVDNDATLDVLQRMALCHAEAGADWVAPSDMMDGRVGAIRHFLDINGHSRVCILSYTAKYASCFYGPFRGALESASLDGLGDKLTYQMDPANRREALREARLDIAEGADALMVKPAGYYLDVLRDLREMSDLPLAAYQVSGEYAMIVSAAAAGWLPREAAILESLTAIKRAGADMILTYFAPEAATLLSKDA